MTLFKPIDESFRGFQQLDSIEILITINGITYAPFVEYPIVAVIFPDPERWSFDRGLGFAAWSGSQKAEHQGL
jgi:hypothetical protein